MQVFKMQLRRWGFAGLLACLGVLALPDAGLADLDIDPDRYCSALGAPPDATTTSDTVPGSTLSLSDVDLTIDSLTYTSSNCYGDFGLDPGDSNPAGETAALNDIFGADSGPNQLHFLGKIDGDGAESDPDGLGGITFEVDADVDETGGNWTVTWTDTNGALPENLPIIVDFVVLLSGGNNTAAYLLSSVLLPVSPTNGSGTFDIQFLNNGGKIPGLSHLLLAGRLVDRPNPIEVPEPATLTLFGAGLLGLWAFRRRRPTT